MGVNIQKGQDVIIYCQLDQPKFVELLVDECYKAAELHYKGDNGTDLTVGMIPEGTFLGGQVRDARGFEAVKR